MVTTLAGTAGQSNSTDGTGTAARFYYTGGVAVDSTGNVFVADENFTIRKITPDGVVRTFAGSAGQPGSDDGLGSAARFYFPRGVAVDSAGYVFVADSGNHTIRKITPTGLVTTLAGDASIIDQRGHPEGGYADGTGSAARFYFPRGVAVDTAGNVYVADLANHAIRRITPDGVVSTLAGSAGQSGNADGIGTAARFNSPTGVAVDSGGNIVVADSRNHTIRKITPDGVVTTLAGTAGEGSGVDGVGSAARFYEPFGVAVDRAGNVYVADRVNHRITKGTPVLQFDTSSGSLTVSNGFFHLRLTGPSGRTVVVEASPDLQAWTPIQTNALPSTGLDLSFPLAPTQNQFFRARLAP